MEIPQNPPKFPFPLSSPTLELTSVVVPLLPTPPLSPQPSGWLVLRINIPTLLSSIYIDIVGNHDDQNHHAIGISTSISISMKGDSH
jgi:hypothetical protein